MAGTTISASSTIGVQLTLATQNPVTITSKGTIVTTGAWALDDAVTISGTDSISNSGKLQGQSGLLVAGAAAAIINLGSISGTNGSGIAAAQSASITNGSATNSTASVTASYAAISIAGTPAASTVINYGTLSGSGFGIDDTNTGLITIINAAPTAVIVGTGNQGLGVTAYGKASVINDGTISGFIGAILNQGGTVANGSLNGSSAANTKALIANGLTLGGANAGMVSNFGTITGGVTFRNTIGGGKVTNSGMISGSNGIGSSTTALTINNSGVILGTAGAGVSSAGVLNLGNLGLIAATTYGLLLGSGGTITNGSILDPFASISGPWAAIYLGGSGSTEINNFGTIGGATASIGIGTNGSGPVTITNGSTADTTAAILAAGYGLSIIRASATMNYGTITGGSVGASLAPGSTIINGTTADTTALIGGTTGVSVGDQCTVANLGTIAGSSASYLPYGVMMSGTDYLTNGSLNDTKALISANGRGWAVMAYGGTIINFGTITDALGGGVSFQYGVLSNYGNIVGATAISTAHGTILNAGVIASSAGASGSAIHMLGASSLVQEAGATITGDVDGSVATVLNNSTITLTGGNGYTSLHVSAIDPSSTGVFQLTGRGALEVAAALGHDLKIQFLGAKRTNELLLDNAANFGTNVGSASYAGPLLEGFSAGDGIDLKGFSLNTISLSYNPGTGILQVASAGKVASLAFQTSSLGVGTFHASNDTYGGTWITHS